MKSLSPFYRSLQPHGDGAWGKERFAEYANRAAPLLPHFPREVLEDWLYRHSSDAIRRYGWLDLRLLRFEKQLWPTQRILSEVRAREDRCVEGWKGLFLDGGRDGDSLRNSKLGAFMREQGSWPIPPVVIADTSHLLPPTGFTLHPCHLIEGHHRLAYLRAIAQMPQISERPEHEIWVVRVENG